MKTSVTEEEPGGTPQSMTPRRRPRLRLVGEEEGSAASDVRDAELVAAVKLGERWAAEVLHDRIRPVIDRTVARLLGCRGADFDDVVQISLIEVVHSLGRFPSTASLLAWTATISSRAVFRFLRRRKLERRIFAGEGLDLDAEVDRDDAPSAVAFRSALRRVRAHLAEIEDTKAWAFLLHDIMGHDVAEVADIMDVSFSAAQQRIARGRRELHARLSSDPDLRDLILELGGER